MVRESCGVAQGRVLWVMVRGSRVRRVAPHVCIQLRYHMGFSGTRKVSRRWCFALMPKAHCLFMLVKLCRRSNVLCMPLEQQGCGLPGWY